MDKEFIEKLESILKDREEKYGNAGDSFDLIAKYWSSYLDIEITKEDVGIMMILLKVSRYNIEKDNLDTFIDIGGYASLGYEMEIKNRH